MGKFAFRRWWPIRRLVSVRLRLQHHSNSTDEQTKSAWSEVLNQYQRRADLIPNLVNTVKGYAAQEQTVLLGRHRGAGQGRLHPGDAGAGQRSGGTGEVSGCAGRN